MMLLKKKIYKHYFF